MNLEYLIIHKQICKLVCRFENKSNDKSSIGENCDDSLNSKLLNQEMYFYSLFTF